MQIALFTGADSLPEGLYVEFAIGRGFEKAGEATSVYLHCDAFELLADVFMDAINGFDPIGPTTISGRTLSQVAEALRAYGKRVGEAEGPGDLWIAESVFGPIFEAGAAWPAHRKSLGLVLRDLRRWLRAAQERGDVVTILA